MSGGIAQVVKRGPPAELRAYSVIKGETLTESLRQIEGWATRPTPDRALDEVVAEGAKFRSPIPLLAYHDHRLPVGRAWLTPSGSKGIRFRAQIANPPEAGALKERCDEIWHSISERILMGISIGFRALETEPIGNGGVRFLKSEIVELSCVTIPMHQDCTIETVKAYGSQQRHAPALQRETVGLSEQERRDLQIARFKRELGSNAGKPVTQLMMHVGLDSIIQRYAEVVRNQRTTAAAFLELDERLKALERRT